jgi:GNAT superfamily N-acetyltransferase
VDAAKGLIASLAVWVEDQKIVGFSAADARNGNIFGLFIEEGHEGRGIGRALFERACDALVEAGCPRMWLTTWPGTRAERFYREAGWQVTGECEPEIQPHCVPDDRRRELVTSERDGYHPP